MVIVLLMVLNLGNILNAGFEQVIVLYSPLVYETSDIIDTLVYRFGLLQAQFGVATAVGLLKGRDLVRANPRLLLRRLPCSPACSTGIRGLTSLIYATHPDPYPVQTYLQILLRGDSLSQAESLSEISEIFHLSKPHRAVGLHRHRHRADPGAVPVPAALLHQGYRDRQREGITCFHERARPNPGRTTNAGRPLPPQCHNSNAQRPADDAAKTIASYSRQGRRSSATDTCACEIDQ